MIHSYLFVFGRTPKLACAELSSLLSSRLEWLDDRIVRTTLSQPLPASEWIQKLGGTIKIAEVLDTVSTCTSDILAQLILRVCSKQRIVFGVSGNGEGFNLSEIKQKLESIGRAARYIAGQDHTLTSVVVEKQNVTELILVKDDDRTIVAHTVAVQPFEDWNRRDYGRPFSDPSSGMLPPKVARMVVNLAVGELTTHPSASASPQAMRAGNSPFNSAQGGQPTTILDPFCGMGTILGEALLSGCRVIGSDQSKEATIKAEKNLVWVTKEFNQKPDFTLLVCDATHISEYLTHESVDAIVTEPYLGSTRVEGKNISNIMKGLEKLYIGCLKDWHKVLKLGGNVVIALPKYVINKREFFVKRVIDSCETLGYTIVTGPIEYSRPQAVVRREFYLLQKI